MKKIFFFLLITGFIAFSCAVDESNSNSGTTPQVSSTSGGSTAGTASETGTVVVTYGGEATITVTTNGGSTQTATTNQSSSTATFTDIPSGEATVKVTPANGGSSTTQVVQINTGETTSVNQFGSNTEIDNSLTVQVYDFTGNNSSGFGNALGTAFFSKEINIPIRYFADGFPGITNKIEYFGVKYSGIIKAPATGAYTFILVCDDGASLAIGGNNVALKRIGTGDKYFETAYAFVQNPKTVPGFKEYDGNSWLVTDFANKAKNTTADSQHAPAIYSATVNMTAGQSYDLVLKYFQGPKYHIACVLKVAEPGAASAKVFSTDMFK